jgi:hypothetical protein
MVRGSESGREEEEEKMLRKRAFGFFGTEVW